MSYLKLPPWVIFHVPHDSTIIPDDVRSQFALSEKALKREVHVMTDHLTAKLFGVGPDDPSVVYAPVSRLVVDVERFRNDKDEPMSQIGMGAVYSATSELERLRYPLSSIERESLLNRFYDPHHSALEAAVTGAIETYGRCMLVDCHSYPRMPLSYELAAQLPLARPEICIGTDSYHTPNDFTQALLSAFNEEGFETRLNTPFSGTLIPSSRYLRDRRAVGVMIEVRRDLYLVEATAQPNSSLESISEKIRSCLHRSIKQLRMHIHS